MNRSIYSLPLLLLILFYSSKSTQAQVKYDSLAKVYLHNGWILRGDTSHLAQGQKIKIETPDQQVFIFSMAEIDSIRPGAFQRNPEKEAGWRNQLQVGFLMHNPEPLPGVDPSLIGNFFSLSLQYIGGFQAESGFSIGAGTGINLFNRGYVIPVFLDMRGDVGKGRIRPIFYGQIGSSIPIYGEQEVEDFWGNVLFEEFEASGGLLVELGTGIKFMARENYAWSFSLGWRLQEITEEYKQWETRVKDEYSFQRISFQMSFIF